MGLGGSAQIGTGTGRAVPVQNFSSGQMYKASVCYSKALGEGFSDSTSAALPSTLSVYGQLFLLSSGLC